MGAKQNEILLSENMMIKGNIITGSLEVNSSNLKVKIINSYENFKKENPDTLELFRKYEWR